MARKASRATLPSAAEARATGERLRQDLLSPCEVLRPGSQEHADALTDTRRLLLIDAESSLIDAIESAAALLALSGDMHSAGHLWLIAERRRARRKNPKSATALRDHNVERKSAQVRKMRFVETIGGELRKTERGRDLSDLELATRIAKRAAKQAGIGRLSKHTIRPWLKGLGLSRSN